MSLNIYTSNRMENLSKAFAKVLEKPLSSPLTTEVVVVQSRGMQRWLAMELAKQFGVWANSNYPFPNAMIQQLFATVLPGVPNSSSFTPEVMTWKILGHLPLLLEREEFLPLRNYLAADQNGLKRFQLAEKIADTFDKYTLFRPEILLEWEKGHEGGWQAILWRELLAASQGQHRGQLMNAFRLQVADNNYQYKKLPERISLFGVSYLPKFHMDILVATSNISEVNLFLLSPTREYWADIQSNKGQAHLTPAYRSLRIEGNPLLASLGKLGRDFSDMIIEAGDFASIQEDLYFDTDRSTILRAIQSDILNLSGSESEQEKTPLDPKDNSIQIHSCHSPMREIEVLHDQILDLLEQQEGLEPRDILVMTTDIEIYAPYIVTVFEGCQDPALKIPFSIADRSLANDGEIVSVLLKLLLLPESRLTIVELLDILEATPVRRCFDLDDDELEMIRHWLEDIRVRWGLNEEDRVTFGLPSYRENTLQAGLDRLLLGYAMPSADDQLFNGKYPYDDIEGSSAGALGKLSEFIDRISSSRERLKRPCTLEQWGTKIRTLLASFIAEEEETARESALVADLVDSLGGLEEKAGYSKEVNLNVVRSWLSDRLKQAEQGYGFMTGGVTFCAMRPMRSIPFKVIALIGMNDGAFPRQSRPPGFDLIAQYPQRGDRSLRDEDRYLFLESLLSARNYFYLSFVGQSIKDNSEIPPSVLVSELLDAINLGFTSDSDDSQKIEKRLIKKHRLQAFNPNYFSRDSHLFSYSMENCTAQIERQRGFFEAKEFLSKPLPEPPMEWKDVSLIKLLRFFANPAKFFLENRLGIYLQGRVEPLEEREPFSLVGLEAYFLKAELLELALEGKILDDVLPTIRALGILPPAQHGELIFAEAVTTVQNFVGTIKEQYDGQNKLKDVDFELDLDGFQITGRLNQIWSNKMIRYRCAKSKPKDQIQTWIEHLILNTLNQEGYPIETLLIMTDSVTSFRPVENAATHLQSLLKLYRQGLVKPLRFFPLSSMEYGKKQEWRLDRAIKAWNGGDRSTGDKEDPHFRLCFGQTPPFDEEFERIARILLEPLLQHQ